MGADELRRIALRVWGSERTSAGQVELGEALHRGADAVAQAVHGARQEPSVACRAGCAHCCWARVVVHPVEVFRLAQWLRESWTADRLADLLRRCRAHEEALRAIPAEIRWWHRPACPLLEDQQCAAYAARPMVCRLHHSYDANACAAVQAGFTEVEIASDPAMHDAGLELVRGLFRAAVQTGVSVGQVEFVAALRLALEHPDLADRWLGGEPVFEEAVDGELLAVLARRKA